MGVIQMSTRKKMALVAFLQAQNCTNLPSSWRHPKAELDFLSPGYYSRIGKVLEEGKFHLAFFDDRLAIPDIYQANAAATLREGIRAVKLDPMICATALGYATRSLGIGVTYSTTYYDNIEIVIDHICYNRVYKFMPIN